MNQRIEELINDYNEAEMIVIGLGSELHKAKLSEMKGGSELISFFITCLEKKNYFVITSDTENLFESTGINEKRVSMPMRLFHNDTNTVTSTETISTEKEKAQWDLYNKWLSYSINKKLLLIELGEGFQNPNLFRWPFEKITFINQKAMLYRINQMFPQIPENIGQRAVSINENAYTFMEILREYIISHNC